MTAAGVDGVTAAAAPSSTLHPAGWAQSPQHAAQLITAGSACPVCTSCPDEPACPCPSPQPLVPNWLQVSELMQRFAEGDGEKEAPVHALKKALQLVAADCHASYAR